MPRAHTAFAEPLAKLLKPSRRVSEHTYIPALLGKRLNVVPFERGNDVEDFMKRYVYAFDSVPAVQKAIKSLDGAKITEDRISLIARPDIQNHTIPAKYLDATTDFAPAVVRGAVIGCATGLIVAIVAMVIPALDVVAAGPTLLA